MPSKKPLSLHPFLLFLYFIFYFFEKNKQETYISDLYLPLIVGFGFIAFLLGIFRLLLGNVFKAGILTSLFIFLFFLHEDIIYNINIIPFGKNILEADKNFFITYSIVFLLVFLFIKYSKFSFSGTTRFFNLFSIILIVFPVFGFIYHQVQVLKIAPKDIRVTLSNHSSPKNKPDVYYIILDSYTNKENLKNFYGFDNQEFISYLEGKGFFVVNNGRSNYQNTNLSMPSSLNMDYIVLPEDFKKTHIIKSLFKDKVDYPKVSLIFKQLGYKTISFGRVHGKAKIYDEKIFYNRMLSPFSFSLLNKSIFKELDLEFLNPDLIQRKQTLFNFEQLKKVSEKSEPTFFYAHFMLPHPPWVFDRDGNLPSAQNVDKTTNSYVEQLMFANKKIKEFFNDLISNSEIQPIIILQADHGFEPATTLQPDEKDLRRLFGVLNSYYFPGIKDTGLYQGITPVNSFRLLFNKYFGMNFDLLPDKSYWKFPLSENWQMVEIPAVPKPVEDPKSLKAANDLWIKRLKNITVESPENFEGRYILGWNYFLEGQNEQAVESIKKSIELNPKFSKGYSSLGRIYIEMKRYDDAAKILATAFELNPSNIEAQIYNGLLHLHNGENQKVVDVFSDPKIANLQYIETHLLLGKALYNLKRFQPAIKSYKQGLEINPWQHELHNHLGEVYNALERYSDAIDSFQASLSIKKRQQKTYLKLALAYEKNKDLQNAYKYALGSQSLNKNEKVDSELKKETGQLIERLKKVSPDLDMKKSLKKVDMKKLEGLIFNR
jgi:tetratricopeptide (TPR) repeat protein